MRKKFLLSMPPEIFQFIKEQAAHENKTMSLYVIEALLAKADECEHYSEVVEDERCIKP